MLPVEFINALRTLKIPVIYGGGATDLKPPFILLYDFSEEYQDTMECYPYNKILIQMDCYDFTLDRVDQLRIKVIEIIKNFGVNGIRVNYFYESERKLHRRSIECILFVNK